MELDTVREEKAIRDLENRLVDSLPEATPEQVGSAVQNAHQRFDGLPIRDFVPILVERIVRRELDSEPVVEKVVTRIETAPEKSGNDIVDSNSDSRHLPETLRAALLSRGRLIPVLGAVGVLVVAAVAVAAVRDSESAPAAAAGAPLTVVEGVVGSEKMAFFDDPRVVDALAKHGIDVDVRPAGSRQIATSVELGNLDFAFPSSLPAAERIQREAGVSRQYTPFSSPMVIATFQPIVDLLIRAGVVKAGTASTFDMSAYLDMVARGTQWDQIEGNTSYPVRKNVLVSTTDPRSSNSAAMYLAVASYVANGNAVVRGSAAEAHVLPLLSRLFLAQGYTENSSEGPFGEYLAAGMGPAPMVWAYEAQYVAAAVDGRIKPEMKLLYPSPTVLSRHSLVPLSDDGDRVGQLLSTDPQLQALAAEHGFRTGDAAKFDAVTVAHDVPVARDLIDVVDIPAYETLENLLNGVANSYN